MLSRSPSEDGRNDLEQGEADLAPDDDEGGTAAWASSRQCPNVAIVLYQRRRRARTITTEKRRLRRDTHMETRERDVC